MSEAAASFWADDAEIKNFGDTEPEQRFCLPNTRFLLYRPVGGVRGVSTDINIEAIEIIKMRECINHIIVRETGQPLKRSSDTDRNYWMSAEEAVVYGMVSRIITYPSLYLNLPGPALVMGAMMWRVLLLIIIGRFYRR
jgi:ATP-dependent Clp protease protease subunit